MRQGLREWARHQRELFDDPGADGATVVASLADVARANRFFGGAAAALKRLDEFFRVAGAGTTLTLLDVGTGDGDIPRAAQRRAERWGVKLSLLALERHPAAARHAARHGAMSVARGDARALPLRSRSADLVLCSQLLHHFHDAELTTLIAELDRVARLAVVVADIRPNPVAAVGIWLASYLLSFHRVTRRDGVVSVLRGFTSARLRQVCAAAGVDADVRTHAGFRVTAAWRPAVHTRHQ